jgi:hypothetical protein
MIFTGRTLHLASAPRQDSPTTSEEGEAKAKASGPIDSIDSSATGAGLQAIFRPAHRHPE